MSLIVSSILATIILNAVSPPIEKLATEGLLKSALISNSDKNSIQKGGFGKWVLDHMSPLNSEPNWP